MTSFPYPFAESKKGPPGPLLKDPMEPWWSFWVEDNWALVMFLNVSQLSYCQVAKIDKSSKKKRDFFHNLTSVKTNQADIQEFLYS